MGLALSAPDPKISWSVSTTSRASGRRKPVVRTPFTNATPALTPRVFGDHFERRLGNLFVVEDAAHTRGLGGDDHDPRPVANIGCYRLGKHARFSGEVLGGIALNMEVCIRRNPAQRPGQER